MNVNATVSPLQTLLITDLEISIVIPINNEAENIPIVASELTRAMNCYYRRWECVWIDDGSSDQSSAILEKIVMSDKCHRLVKFEENSGKAAAYWEGFRQARGWLIATLDGDGQNDPNDIPILAKFVLSGMADMAHGYRERRRDGVVRKFSSRIGNRFRIAITGNSVRDVGCATRVFKRECVEYLPRFAGLHRFLATLVAMNGFRVVDLPVNHRPRMHGMTKYGIGNRLWVGLLDTLGVWWLQKRSISYQIKATQINKKSRGMD